MELLIFVLIVLALVFFVATLYNKLVRLRNAFRNAFAQIDVQLKRRHDLIPNLVEAVQGYMQHERETLTAVIEARNTAEQVRESTAGAAGDAGAMAELGKAEGLLGGALGQFFALSESYPDLKASANFQSLQEELTSTENRVAYARQAYNDAIMKYNNAVESVPSNMIAGMFNFKPGAPLDFEEEREQLQEAPKVSFR